MHQGLHKILTGIIIGVLVGILGLAYYAQQNVVYNEPLSQQEEIIAYTTPVVQNSDEPRGQDTKSDDESEDPNSYFQLPNSIALPVPFTVQAPTANWDALHNDACEEASVIMAASFFNGMTEVKLTPAFVEQEINKIVAWEDTNLGYNKDSTLYETGNFATSIYGLQTEIIELAEDAIKQQLNKGRPIILSANGRLLGNPNFKPPGPLHHMLVIIGYDSEGFITNDPGTRKGAGYRYNFDKLYKATGDWDHAAKTVDTTIKQALVVWK